MAERPSILARTISTPIILIAILLVVALIAVAAGSGPFTRTTVELLIRVMIVVGLYTFIGNSGVISFGHIAFMCMGAYATAWFTIPLVLKKNSFPGLPEFILKAQLPFYVSSVIATVFVGIFAYLFGKILMRLSGIAASIATFAMLAVVNTVYSHWDSITGGTSTVAGVPMKTGLWTAFIGAVIAIIVAYLYAISRSGLALRAARDEPIAASASGVDIVRERLRAFVISGLIIGFAGALYAHFLGVLNPDAFYMGTTFITLSMLRRPRRVSVQDEVESRWPRSSRLPELLVHLPSANVVHARHMAGLLALGSLFAASSRSSCHLRPEGTVT